jgi:hypothetical protein
MDVLGLDAAPRIISIIKRSVSRSMGPQLTHCDLPHTKVGAGISGYSGGASILSKIYFAVVVES